MPPHFFSMLKAELGVVFRRPTGIAVLVVGLAVGVLLVGVLQVIKLRLQVSPESAPMLDQFLQNNAAETAGWALRARNFYVLPLFLLLATGNALATEREDHTLRELLVRPVTRWSVVLAKFLALLALSLVSLVASLVPSLAGGLVLFGEPGPVVDLLLGYGASALSDAGLIALGLLAGTLVRGAGGVVVAVIALLMADMAARGLLWALGLAGLAGAEAARAYLPGAALAAWEGWTAGWAWQPFAGLAVLIGLGLGLTLWRVETMDVP